MPSISIDHSPSGKGFAVICNAAAKKHMSNFPDHIAFWEFGKWKDAEEYALRLQKLSGGVATVWDERPVCWDLASSKAKLVSKGKE